MAKVRWEYAFKSRAMYLKFGASKPENEEFWLQILDTQEEITNGIKEKFLMTKRWIYPLRISQEIQKKKTWNIWEDRIHGLWQPSFIHVDYTSILVQILKRLRERGNSWKPIITGNLTMTIQVYLSLKDQWAISRSLGTRSCFQTPYPWK